jgi:hypothetical protein
LRPGADVLDQFGGGQVAEHAGFLVAGAPHQPGAVPLRINPKNSSR